MLEQFHGLRIGHAQRGAAQPGGDLVAALFHLLFESAVPQPLPLQQPAQPIDRIPPLPQLQFGGIAIAGGIVGGGVRAHSIGDGLDERRPAAGTGANERLPGHGQDRECVIAVHLHGGNAVADGPARDRRGTLHPRGRADRPAVVLAEEHHRRTPGGGEAERLGDIALTGGAVAEVGDGGDLRALEMGGVGVSGGVQSLCADHDRRIGHPVSVRVPAGMGDAAPEPGHILRGHAAAVGDGGLAVGAEHVIVGVQGVGRADLRRLLAEQRWPQSQLALPLQCGGLGVYPAGHDHIGVHGAQFVAAGIGHQRGVHTIEYAMAVGLDQLHRVGVLFGHLYRLLEPPGTPLSPWDCVPCATMCVLYHQASSVKRSAQVSRSKLCRMLGQWPARRVILRFMSSNEPASGAMDATDARLLLELVANPRATGVELAARLGLSRNTVQARLARWEANAVLASFERRVEPRALGYPLAAFVAVVVDQHKLDAVVAELARIPEVTEVCGMTGPTDLTARVVAQDADDLYRIAGHILKIPGVERTNMALIMRSLVGPRTTPLLDRLAGGNGNPGTNSDR